MANLDDLDLNPDTIDDVDPETVPLFGGGIAPPPQPGRFVFRLPSAPAIMNCFEKQETADQGQRIQAVFRDEAALWNDTVGQPYECRISNRTRTINTKNGPVVLSDMAQLLRAVDSIPPKEDRSNAAYGHALIQAAERRFMAENTLTATCSPTRDIYKDGTVLKGKKGCGQRYAVEGYSPKAGKPVIAIPRTDDGKVAVRFKCGCGAELRAWGQLRNFRKLKESK